jgi:hypothetical protein
MKREELEKFVGKVVCLDLVNHERPVGRLVEITEDGHAVIKNPFAYVPVQVGTTMQVQAISYAAPLFDVKKISVSLDHIIARLDVPTQMEQAYVRETSGVITETKPSIIVP